MRTNVKFILPVICLALADGMQAAVRYWDANGANPGAGATPTGTWGADIYWSTNANGIVPTTGWTFADTAVFSAGTDAMNPATVFVSGTQTAGSLTFEEGPVTLSGGTIASWTTPFTIAANVNVTIDSVLAGPQVLTKTGTGTLWLNGTNIYTHETIVGRGVLVAGNPHALGTGLAGTTISNGATLEVSGGIALGGLLRVYGTGALRSTGGSNWVASILFDQSVSPSGSLSSETGVLALGRVEAGKDYELSLVGDGDTIISGDDPSYGLIWSGAGGKVKKYGTGTIAINGPVTTRGSFIVLSGTVKMGASHRFGNYEGIYPDLWVSASAVFDLNGFDVVVDGLLDNGTYAGTVTNSGSSTLVVGTNSYLVATHRDPADWSGVLAGDTTLKKEGPRKEIFAGNNTYTGNTFINAGTLELWGTGSVSNSPTIYVAPGATFLVATLTSPSGFVLNSNQTLMGSGTVTGLVTVAAGGRIRPGDSVGKMTFALRPGLNGGLNLSAGGTNIWELGDRSTSHPGTNFDQIVMIGSPLVLGGASTLSIRFIGTATAPDASDPFWQESRAWHVISATNVVANFAAIENGSYPAGDFSTSVDTNGVWLTFTPSSPRPRITAISNPGTGSVTVNYTNTLPGTNYVLAYSTNLDLTNWSTVGDKTAASASDFQTDNAATNNHRFYRVYHVTP